jgi:hypothetical protein
LKELRVELSSQPHVRSLSVGWRDRENIKKVSKKNIPPSNIYE